ncbi:CHAT domain-containing protein [Streptomyces sp. NPDC056470]|uniref:CHAT domain-containing protein n=1 Tax=Streptomyces sp. NPDC056470 TaxID=3345831 RepID=UPI0036774C16
MVAEHVVELRLTDTDIEVGVGPRDSEVWSATVRLTLPGSPEVTASATGRAEGLRGYTASFRRELGQALPLGSALRGLLLPHAVEAALFEGCLRTLRREDSLRIMLYCADPRFAALPWELTRTRFPEPFPDPGEEGDEQNLRLVNRFYKSTLARVVGHNTPPGPRGRLRTLVVNAASAHGDVHAAQGTHLGTQNGISGASRRDADWTTDMVSYLSARLGDTKFLMRVDREGLSRELSTPAHVLCVIAHGWALTPETSGVVLHGSGGAPAELLTAAELAELVRASGTQLVVLVACNTAGAMEGFEGWGNTAEQLVASGIPAVVAMQTRVQPHLAHRFLVALVRGLSEHAEIHAALAAGLDRIRRGDLEDYLSVPALFTAPNGLRLVDVSPRATAGSRHAYPVVPAAPNLSCTAEAPPGDHVGTEGQRVRMDAVWVADRLPFAGVLIDIRDHDLSADLNEWEREWDAVLDAHGMRPRRWFASPVELRPAPGDAWQKLAAPTQGLWNDFQAQFRGKADDGWVLKANLPDGGLSQDTWQTLIDPWCTRLTGADGTLTRPLIVALDGWGPTIQTKGAATLVQIRDALERRLSIPVTALSRHRPGRPREAESPANGTAQDLVEAEGATESALRHIRLTDPTRYQRLLAHLVRRPELNSHKAALATAADYDDDVRNWVTAVLKGGAHLPTPRGLLLTVKSEQADAIVMSLIRLRAPHHIDFRAWDVPSLSPPVRALLRQYRSVWSAAEPTSLEVAEWLAANPESAMAVQRAGFDWSTAEVLRRLPHASAPWPLIRAAGVDAETLEILLGLPMEQRRALGLVNTGHALPPVGFEARLLVEEIQSRLGRRTTIFHTSSPGKAGQ